MMFRDSFSLVQADIQYMPIQNRQLGYILCSRVLSHVRDYRLVLSEFSRLLKSGGSLFIADVHPLHTYEYTGIDTNDGRINIETYKHSLGDIRSSAPIYDLELLDHKEYSLANIIKEPQRVGFEKLFLSPTQPIFYTLQFRKK